jgi:hypothetical protein
MRVTHEIGDGAADKQIAVLFDAVRKFLAPPEPSKKNLSVTFTTKTDRMRRRASPKLSPQFRRKKIPPATIGESGMDREIAVGTRRRLKACFR